MREKMTDHKMDNNWYRKDMKWYFKKNIKTAGIEERIKDNLEGMQEVTIEKALKTFPKNPEELTKDQWRKIRDLSLGDYVPLQGRINLFKAYPTITFLSIYHIAKYYNQYNPKREEIGNIWNLYKEHGLREYGSLSFFPIGLPSFIQNNIAIQFIDIIPPTLASEMFVNHIRGNDDYTPLLINSLKKAYPDVWEYVNRPNVDSLIGFIQQAYHDPSKNNIDKVAQAISSITQLSFLPDIVSEKEREEGRKHNEEVYKMSYDINKMILRLSELERNGFEKAHIDRERFYYGNNNKFYDYAENILKIFNSALTALEGGENYFNEDIGLRVNVFEYDGRKFSTATIMGYHLSPEALRESIDYIEKSTNKENDVYFTIDYGKIKIEPYDMDEKELETEAIVCGDYKDSKDNYYGKNINNKTLGSFLSYNSSRYYKTQDKLIRDELAPFITGTATDEEWLSLPKNYLFFDLAERAGDEAGKMYVHDYTPVPLEEYMNTENPFGKSITTDNFINLYSEIIKNMPQRIRLNFEERSVDYRSGNNGEEGDYPLMIGAWGCLCSGLFSPDFVRKHIEKWPSDAMKVRRHIKTNGGKEVDDQLKDYLLNYNEENKRKFDEYFSEYLDSEKVKIYSINDFPELRSYCEDFLKLYTSNKTVRNYNTGEEHSLVDQSIKELDSIDICVIQSNDFINTFGETELIKNGVHPGGSNGFYMDAYSRKNKKRKPVAVVFTQGSDLNLTQAHINEISEILGLRPLGTSFTAQEEQTMWHEVTHGLFDIAFGGFEHDEDYGTPRGWINDVEEIRVLSSGNLEQIKRMVTKTVENRFPTDPAMVGGFINQMKGELIDSNPDLLYGYPYGFEEGEEIEEEDVEVEEGEEIEEEDVEVEEGEEIEDKDYIITRKKFDKYFEEQKEEILASDDIDDMRKSVIDMFSQYLLSLNIKKTFFDRGEYQPHKTDFSSEYVAPEPVGEDFVANKKDDIIIDLEKRDDYRAFVSQVRERIRGAISSGNEYLLQEYKFYINRQKNDMRPIFSLFDLAQYIFNTNSQFLFDINTKDYNDRFIEFVPESLLLDVTRIIENEKQKMSIPYRPKEPDIVTEDELMDLGKMIYETEEELGPGWQDLASWYPNMKKTASVDSWNATVNDINNRFWVLMVRKLEEDYGIYTDEDDLEQETLNKIQEEIEWDSEKYPEDGPYSIADYTLDDIFQKINRDYYNAFEEAFEEWQREITKSSEPEWEFEYPELLEALEPYEEEIYDEMKEEYGETPYWSLTGAVLPDGTGLNFDEGEGYRTIDHNSLVGFLTPYTQDVIDDTEQGHSAKHQKALMAMGVMEIVPEAKAVLILQPPTEEQINWIRNMVDSAGEIFISFRDNKEIEVNRDNVDQILNNLFGG